MYDVISISVYTTLSLIVTVLILHAFTSKHKPPIPIILILVYSYCMSLSALSLLSIDVADGLYHTRDARSNDSNGAYQSPQYLRILWLTFYWSIQILAWILLPVCQAYLDQGHFTWYRKLFGAIIANLILYIVLGVVGLFALIALLIWLISNKQSGGPSDLMGFCIALSNTFGMTLLIFLLGYGIAKLPKWLWHRANYLRTLHQYHFRASKIYDELDEAKEEYVQKLQMLRALDMNVEEDDPNRRYVDYLTKSCFKDLNKFKVSALESTSRDISTCTYKSLVKLHKKIVAARRKYKASSYLWEWLQKKVYHIEAVLDAKRHSANRRIVNPFKGERRGPMAPLIDSLEFFWYVWFRPLFFRISAVFFFIFALVLVFCEFSIFFQQPFLRGLGIPNLSLFALIKKIAAAKVVLQIFSLLLMSFFTYIVFFGLFKLKIFKLYSLIPHHSDAASMLFSAVVLTRVVPALCYNFLQLLGITDKDGVSFFDVMGLQQLELKFFGSIGDFFQYNFPVFIVVVALLTFFDAPARIGSLFSIERFVYDKHFESERVREGREVIAACRRRKLLEVLKDGESRTDRRGSGNVISSNTRLTSLSDSDSDGEFGSHALDDLDDYGAGRRESKRSTAQRIKSLFRKHGRGSARSNESSQISLDDNALYSL